MSHTPPSAMSAVVDTLQRLFGERGVRVADLDPNAPLAEHLDWDSMDVVDLGMEFRRRLGVSLPEDVHAIDTIARLVAIVEAAGGVATPDESG